MLKKRIIPCLDIQNGRTVKGVRFVSIRDAGDPVALACRYVEEGADELVFLDISATQESRMTQTTLVRRLAQDINIPFTVGGGIRSKDDASLVIRSGADKISLNSAAVQRPQLITEIAAEFGSQSVVVAIDSAFTDGKWTVMTHGGKVSAGRSALQWAEEAVTRGAGEILLTSMSHDGTRQGFAIELLQDITSRLSVPVIASGGAGSMAHFRDVFAASGVSGALAASIFHFGDISVRGLKQYLQSAGIPVRE